MALGRRGAVALAHPAQPRSVAVHLGSVPRGVEHLGYKVHLGSDLNPLLVTNNVCTFVVGLLVRAGAIDEVLKATVRTDAGVWTIQVFGFGGT